VSAASGTLWGSPAPAAQRAKRQHKHRLQVGPKVCWLLVPLRRCSCPSQQAQIAGTTRACRLLQLLPVSLFYSYQQLSQTHTLKPEAR
jgi:hypothetical protein